jgi:hypothetical protein
MEYLKIWKIKFKNSKINCIKNCILQLYQNSKGRTLVKHQQFPETKLLETHAYFISAINNCNHSVSFCFLLIHLM